MALVNPGYMGIANIAGVGNVRFNSANIVAKQAVNAPDLIMGDFNRNAWVYEKVDVSGSISGPVTETFSAGGGGIWDWATARDNCGNLTEANIDLQYYCGEPNGLQSVTNALANSISFNCTAGEIAEFSLDVIGQSAGAFSNSPAGSVYTDAEKLVTWDQVAVSISGSGIGASALSSSCFESFEFTVNNNVEARYAICAGQDLFPYALVPGLRSVSGSLTAYNIPSAFGVDNWTDYSATDVSNLSFNIGGTVVNAVVAFHRVEPSASTGPILSTIAFTGVTVQNF